MKQVHATKEQIERAARIYHTRKDAARAVGIAPETFGRLMNKYGVKTKWRR